MSFKDSGIEWLSHIPSDWEVKKLKYLAEIIDGDRGSEYPNDKDLVDNGILFLSGDNLKSNGFNYSKVRFISEEKFAKLGRGKVLKNDIITSVRGTIGSAGLFSGEVYEQAFINAESDEKGKIYSYYINKFLKIIGLFVPCFIAISYIAAPIIGGSNYEGVGYYIPLSISAAFISELSGVFSVIIAVNKKTIQTLISTFAGAIVNVLLVYLLIDRFGVNGSNIALNIGFLLSAFIRFKFAKRDIFMVCEIKWLVLYIIEIFLFSLALKNGWEIIYGVFALILWFILNREDIKNIYNDVVFYVKNKEKIK